MPDVKTSNPPLSPSDPIEFGGTGEIGTPFPDPGVGPGPGGEKVGVGPCARQVLGLVPLNLCDLFVDPDCRDDKPHPMDCPYAIPVFASILDTDGHVNDFTTMTVDTYTNSGVMTVTWFLDKCVGGAFVEQEEIDANSTVGTLLNLAFVGFPTYSEVLIIWRDVLINFGSGTYRIRVRTILDGENTCDQCTEPFCLKPFSCEQANGTVRWTIAYGAGTIGSITDPTVTFGTPSANLYQIRVNGGFGDETSEYDLLEQEYQNGAIVKIRDEAIQKYVFNSDRLPNWFHKRFKSYALLAPSIRVDDYNLNNPDYEIKQLRVTRDGNYEPERNRNSRLTKVSVNFKSGIQNVEARTC